MLYSLGIMGYSLTQVILCNLVIETMINVESQVNIIYIFVTFLLDFYNFYLFTSNTNSNKWVIILSFVEGAIAIGDCDLLLALMDDVTVFTIWKPRVEVDIVEVAHCKETFLASAEPKAAILHLPVGLSITSYSIGKLEI